VPERATKEKNLTSYAAFGGVAILDRIAALFFSTKFEAGLQNKARAPPHSDLISKIQIGG